MSLPGGVLSAVPGLPHTAVRAFLGAGDTAVRASVAASDDAPPLTTPRDPAREAARRELSKSRYHEDDPGWFQRALEPAGVVLVVPALGQLAPGRLPRGIARGRQRRRVVRGRHRRPYGGVTCAQERADSRVRQPRYR